MTTGSGTGGCSPSFSGKRERVNMRATPAAPKLMRAPSAYVSWGSSIRFFTSDRGGNQITIRHRLRVDQSHQRVAEQVGVFTVVVAEGHLVQIGRQVLDAQVVVRTDHR